MSQGAFGSRQPWSEPSWSVTPFYILTGAYLNSLFSLYLDRYHGRPSPYYTESHKKLRNVLRAWTTKVCEYVSGVLFIFVDLLAFSTFKRKTVPTLRVASFTDRLLKQAFSSLLLSEGIFLWSIAELA
jgi:hypothetical protein